jgi:two-component system, response regulator FlrC
MLKIAVVDSDELFLAFYKELCKDVLTENSIISSPITYSCFSDLDSFTNSANKEIPDVLILAEELITKPILEHFGTFFNNHNFPKVIITSIFGRVDAAVKFFKQGVVDYLQKPISRELLGSVLANLDKSNLVVRDIEIQSSPRKSLKSSLNNISKLERPIITVDPVMKRILEVTEVVAKSDATVLLQGESGTGKELVARFIHGCSKRSHNSFVAVNCAALPENLLESELFGHEKGSFTGAIARKVGKFEQAEGGSILLDEISEMNLLLQAKLLRVLQEREVSRVGGYEPISIDVRIIATTNRKLDKMVKNGLFREDLYYRLNVVPITLPPLRDRKNDIKILFDFFAKRYLGEALNVTDENIFEYLKRYDWPGNVRELQNCVERASVLSFGRKLREEDFLLEYQDLTQSLPSNVRSSQDKEELSSKIEKSIYNSAIDNPLLIKSGMTVAQAEKFLIEETLKNTNNNRTKAAQLLGISIRTLRNKLGEYEGEQS